MQNEQKSQSHTSILRVLIKTLPLTSGNYGGILQAFALQSYVRSMGHDAIVDTPILHRQSWRTPLGMVRRALFAKTFDVAITPRMRNMSQVETTHFIQKYIQTIDLFDTVTGRAKKKIAANFDVLVSGSDQVWRPEYADVESYMFDFADTSKSSLVSYAASFGRKDLSEFGAKGIDQAKRNLRRFSAISVREQNGVSLASELGVKAQFVLDPTLLAGRPLFESLLLNEPELDDPKIAIMMLDNSPSRDALVGNLQSYLGRDSKKFYPEPLISRSRFKESPQNFIKPSVESWINTIRSAPFIVTDSYHVTLFAILFEKDFLSIGNSQRGFDRFDSILTALGLTDRLVDENQVEVPRLERINWNKVNSQLQLLRKSSSTFLHDALGVHNR